jgi:hypothetical protein|tara:strand:- start:1705 stop:2451 length:747 start_codon:yes stop_codon:yes gene_type:complete
MLSSIGMSGPKRARKPKRAKNSNCAHFDGTNDTVVVSDYDISESGTGDFSLALWFKTDDADDITQTTLMMKSEGRFTAWLFWINADDKVSFTAAQSGFKLTYLSEAQSNDLAGEWNHIVYTCDRDAGQTVYINGSALTEETDTIADTTSSVNNTANVEIGATGSNFLDGKISEYASFSKALSAAEVSFLYKKQGRFNLSRSKFGGNLTCWLQMGDGTEIGAGATVYDMSANSNNGTMTDGTVFAADAP